MEKDLLQETLDLCKKYNILPARSKGQNFLINEEVYQQIIRASALTKEENILEVGPGLGFLTQKLAEKSAKVVAVELDDKLAKVLVKRMEESNIKNVEVVNEDILQFFNFQSSPQPESLGPKAIFNHLNNKYKIVANLPYNITSIFLRKFVSEVEHKPEMLVLMLQKEVAERIVAKPGKMSLLAVSIQLYAEAEIVSYVPKQDFWPVPEVDSAIIRILPRNELRRNPIPADAGIGFLRDDLDEKKFFQLVKFGFSSKRKMLKNNLAGGYNVNASDAEKWLTEANIKENIRAEGLAVVDWIELLKIVEKHLEV